MSSPSACFHWFCTLSGAEPESDSSSLTTPEDLAAACHRAGISVEAVEESTSATLRRGGVAILFARDGTAAVCAPGSGVSLLMEVTEHSAGNTGAAGRFTLTPLDPGSFKSLGWALIPKIDPVQRFTTPAWFWSAVAGSGRHLPVIIVATVLVNLFAITMPLFSMAVYDRVVPNHALETLWALAAGIGVVFVFDFIIRQARGRLVDTAAREVDAVLARRLHRKALYLDLHARPASAGSFAAKLRGYESVRDFFSSATLVTLVDVPFSLLMLGLVFMLAGEAGWIPVAAAGSSLLLTGALLPVLSRLTRSSYEQSVERQALVSEMANGLESIRAANAEGASLDRLSRTVAASQDADLRSRRWSLLASSGAAFCINLASVGVVIACVYRIHAGLMTMGGLIACSMIVGRAMSPLAGVVALLLRLQQTRAMLRSLHTIMALLEDNSVLTGKIRYPQIEVSGAAFTYPGQPLPSLREINLRIAPGERVGIIGRAGAGKSTLLRILARLQPLSEGLVLLNGVDIRQWDGRAVRASCGYLPQDGVLLHGTIRENILLGSPAASDEQLLAAATAAGATDWVNLHPSGFARQVGERGILLSGGQRQTVLLARCFLGHPDVFLLDEPTSGFDPTTEKRFMEAMTSQLKDDPRRTLLLATHRPHLLTLVDRIILLDAGRLIADGPRDKVLELLRQRGSEPITTKDQP